MSRGAEITVQGGAVNIDSSTFIGPWSTIVAKDSIMIGRDVLIAERVTIRDQDHEIRGSLYIPISQAGFRTAPVIIGDGAWIGAGAVVLKGTNIGRGAVVAANAVVNRNVDDLEIVGGVPAKHIGIRG